MMTRDIYRRNANITLVYKNMYDGTFKNEQLIGRSEEDFNVIAGCMPRCFDSNPDICLTRKITDVAGEDRMEVTLIPLRKKFGTQSKVALYHLVYVEYVIDPDVV